MREFQNHLDYEISKTNVRVVNRLKLFILKPIFVGLFTFSIFFTTILTTKLFAYLFSEHIIFNINIYDVIFAFIGFGVGFIFELAIVLRKILLK